MRFYTPLDMSSAENGGYVSYALAEKNA
jgi:hypothetical protein